MSSKAADGLRISTARIAYAGTKAGRQRLLVDFNPGDRPRPLRLAIFPPSEQPVVWINEVPGTVAGEGGLIGIAPARREDHQSGNPPLKMSDLSRRLNDGEWLTNPLPRHGVKARLDHFVPEHMASAQGAWMLIPGSMTV